MVVRDGREYLVVVGRHRVTVAQGRCPHMGASLATATVGRRTLTCAHHGHRYSLSDGAPAGRLVCSGRAGRLTLFPTRVVEGVLYAEVPAAA